MLFQAIEFALVCFGGTGSRVSVSAQPTSLWPHHVPLNTAQQGLQSTHSPKSRGGYGRGPMAWAQGPMDPLGEQLLYPGSSSSCACSPGVQDHPSVWLPP